MRYLHLRKAENGNICTDTHPHAVVFALNLFRNWRRRRKWRKKGKNGTNFRLTQQYSQLYSFQSYIFLFLWKRRTTNAAAVRHNELRSEICSLFISKYIKIVCVCRVDCLRVRVQYRDAGMLLNTYAVLGRWYEGTRYDSMCNLCSFKVLHLFMHARRTIRIREYIYRWLPLTTAGAGWNKMRTHAS